VFFAFDSKATSIGFVHDKAVGTRMKGKKSLQSIYKYLKFCSHSITILRQIIHFLHKRISKVFLQISRGILQSFLQSFRPNFGSLNFGIITLKNDEEKGNEESGKENFKLKNRGKELYLVEKISSFVSSQLSATFCPNLGAKPVAYASSFGWNIN
jgi:hypothetical protein